MNASKILLRLLMAAIFTPFAANAQQNVTFDLTKITYGDTTYQDTVNELQMNVATNSNWDGNSTPGFVAYDTAGLSVINSDSYNSSITFTFDKDVRLKSSQVGFIGGFIFQDVLEISFESGGNTITRKQDLRFVSNGSTFNYNYSQLISAGDAITFTCKEPNGRNNVLIFNQLTVEAVPEPATYGLILAGASLLFVMLSRRNRS